MTPSPLHEAPALPLPTFRFDNRFARELEGLYVPWQATPSPSPRLVRLNHVLAAELGLEAQALATPAGLAVLAGIRMPEGAQPLAQAYAGHQFGGFSPQLGDGRALLLGEVIDAQGRRRDIAFKGSGRTPFSRGGDGKAALGPVLREYLIGEAMHALGIPTTRALAAVATGEPVRRETTQPGALLTRVAASHLRVGSFEYVSVRQDVELLRRLAEHAISRHDPDLAGHPMRHLELLRRVCERQAALVARWMGVGFIHGVMNTDNMTVSGETIDYGPCAFVEAYDPRAVFSSIDTRGRYAFGNQPGIAQWNLARLAETLLPLIDADAERAVELGTAVIESFPSLYQAQWTAVVRAKLALDETADPIDDLALAGDYLRLLHEQQVDHTLGFRRLADALRGDEAPLRALFGAAAQPLSDWLGRWHARLGLAEGVTSARAQATALAEAMDRTNPAVIARNHRVEEALSAAVERDDLAPFDRLLSALARPFDASPSDAEWLLPAPAAQTACYQTFCGT